MRNVLLALTAVAAFSGSASAADLAARPYTKAPPPMAIAPSWTGCYIGGNAGWIGGDDRINTFPDGSFNTVLTPADIAAVSVKDHRPQGSGFTGGGQIGCNYQTGAFVWGVEADFNGSGLKETDTASFDAGNIAPFTQTVTKDVSWFATFRGRLGYTWDRLLVYGTGGLAVARYKSTYFRMNNEPNGTTFGSDSWTSTGWVAGAGLEYALSQNWSIKAEYLYLDFGSHSFYSGGPFGFTTRITEREQVVRAGVNYKFDWGKAPVVAKY